MVSGVHHQMARRTGQAATITPAAAPRMYPQARPASRAMMGCHRLAATVAARTAGMTQVTENTTLALRREARRTGSSMTVIVPLPRPDMPRLDEGMTQLPLRQVACVIEGLS